MQQWRGRRSQCPRATSCRDVSTEIFRHRCLTCLVVRTASLYVMHCSTGNHCSSCSSELAWDRRGACSTTLAALFCTVCIGLVGKLNRSRCTLGCKLTRAQGRLNTDDEVVGSEGWVVLRILRVNERTLHSVRSVVFSQLWLLHSFVEI